MGMLRNWNQIGTPKLKNSVSFGSPLGLPKLESIVHYLLAMLHDAHLEKDHSHGLSKIGSGVEEMLKMHVFLHFLRNCAQSLSISHRSYHGFWPKLKKHRFCAIFPVTVQIEDIPSLGISKSNCFYLSFCRGYKFKPFQIEGGLSDNSRSTFYLWVV